MLARAGFRDDARLAHFHREQPLADGVVDLVRAGVQQVFALQINAWAAEFCRQSRGKLQRRGTPGKIPQQAVELSLELRVAFCGFVNVLELVQRHHQCFGDVAAAVRAEAAGRGGRDGELAAHGNIHCRIDRLRGDTLGTQGKESICPAV